MKVHLLATEEAHTTAYAWCGKELDYDDRPYTRHLTQATCRMCVSIVRTTAQKQLDRLEAKKR